MPPSAVAADIHQRYAPTRSRLSIREVWESLPVAMILANRDIRVRYRQSLLGPVWLVLQPLGMLVAVTVAFRGITQVETYGLPYPLFALCGLCAWTFVQLTLTNSANAIVINSPLVRRSTCPRSALIHGVLLSNLPTLAVMVVVTLTWVRIEGALPLQALLLPAVIAWTIVWAWGPSLILGGLAARFRDAIAVVPLLLQAGAFASPVGYSMAGTDGALHWILAANPLSGLLEAWRWVLIDSPPDGTALAFGAGWTVFFCVAGWRLFSRLEVDFADYV